MNPRKPSPVAEVFRTLTANAKSRALDSHREQGGNPKVSPSHHWMVGCYFASHGVYAPSGERTGTVGEWLCGSAYESSGSLVFREGEWFYRTSHDGSDSPISHSEALANASIWFTG